MIHWNKLKIKPTNDMTDADVRDFVEWVTKKAERLGFHVELDLHKESGSGSSEAVSPNPLATNESD